MLARDVMTLDVATIAPNAPLHVVAETMIERGVTGLAVVDGSLKLLGLVTESDLLHRLAAAEQVQHGYLWGVFRSINRQADEYARSHGHLAADVMTLVEDIITGLSQSKSLVVIARHSTFTYKGKVAGNDEIKFSVSFGDNNFDMTAKRVK